MAGPWFSSGSEGIWGRYSILAAARSQATAIKCRILFWLGASFPPPPPFIFCLHFLFPLGILLGECNEIKNRKNSALLRKGVPGSLHPSQPPTTPRGTTQLLRL